MARHGQVVLHFVQLGAPYLGERVLLSVDHTSLQPNEDLGQSHRRRVGSISLEELDPPHSAGSAKLDARQVGRSSDGPLIVRHMAKSVLPDTEHSIPRGLRKRCEIRPYDRLLDGPHVLPIHDEIGHLEQAKRIDLGRHHRGREGEVDGAQFDLL